MIVSMIKSELGGGRGISSTPLSQKETTVIHVPTYSTVSQRHEFLNDGSGAPIWPHLLDVAMGKTRIDELFWIAMGHRGGKRMVAEAVVWGLCSKEDMDQWELDMCDRAEHQAGADY